jgi:hypothetical protein
MIRAVAYQLVVTGRVTCNEDEIHTGHERSRQSTRFIPDVITVTYPVGSGRGRAWSAWIEGPRVLVDDTLSPVSRAGAVWTSSNGSVSGPDTAAPAWLLAFVEANRPYEMAA